MAVGVSERTQPRNSHPRSPIGREPACGNVAPFAGFPKRVLYSHSLRITITAPVALSAFCQPFGKMPSPANALARASHLPRSAGRPATDAFGIVGFTSSPANTSWLR